MSNKDLADMIDIAFGILIVFGSILWFWLYLKLDKIYDELKEIRKEKKDVKHGEWAEDNDYVICSICDIRFNKGDNDTEWINYCPNCGADMRGETE